MPKCSRCCEEKDITCFNHETRAKSGYRSSCRECTNKYHKENFGKKYSVKKLAESVAWLQSIKSGNPCLDCGEIYEPYCMDYDHVRGVKVKSVTRMVLEHMPRDRILEEIKKCELVCILCHNKRTFERTPPATKDNERTIRNKEIINKAKDRPCYICGEKRELYNMQFDHIDTEGKVMNVCQLKNSSIEKLTKEIEKCRVICALCHRRKTIQEQKEGKYHIRPKPKRRFVDVEAQVQECGTCHEILSFNEFGRKCGRKTGRDCWCKECTNKYNRKRYHERKSLNQESEVV